MSHVCLKLRIIEMKKNFDLAVGLLIFWVHDWDLIMSATLSSQNDVRIQQNALAQSTDDGNLEYTKAFWSLMWDKIISRVVYSLKFPSFVPIWDPQRFHFIILTLHTISTKLQWNNFVIYLCITSTWLVSCYSVFSSNVVRYILCDCFYGFSYRFSVDGPKSSEIE